MVLIRRSVSDQRFDAETFARLCERLVRGELEDERNRLSEAPAPLEHHELSRLPSPTSEAGARLSANGAAAIRAGKFAVVVLNGGMATRFGGGAKGVVPVVPTHPRTSFLACKLADARRIAVRMDGHIPVVVMHSFATLSASHSHLEDIDWGGVPPEDRSWFQQSILPRVLSSGQPLATLPDAGNAPDTVLYAVPGHGDTLGRLRDSGVLTALHSRGVEHVLVSNVDNIAATLDPMLAGAHLAATTDGAAVTVEVVRRAPGDAGGCVARVGGRAEIVEGFRLPLGTELARYPHFNTNTLWFCLSDIDRPLELRWFCVKRSVPWPAGSGLDAIQFEQLIGQATELLPAAFLEVDREMRFLPIKQRDDLAMHAKRLRGFASELGLL